MKKHIITALLITTMISMTACGGKNNTDTPAEETVVATSESVENPTANDEKVVLGTVNKEETTTAETTAEAKTDVKVTTSPNPKATEAPKSTAAPETTAKPKSTETPKATTKPSTQTASVTATTKPSETEKPSATVAPKSTEAPKNTVAPTTAPVVTATPVATATPKATQTPTATVTPAATPAPTATPVACQHTNTHVESSHDTYEVPISGGCVEVWCTATRVCNDCGANLGEAPEKVNEVHTNVVHKEGVSATCTTDGYSAVYGCDCGSQPEVGGDVIPAFGHDYHDEYVSSDVIKGEDGIPTGIIHHYQSVCYTCGDVSRTWDETEN